MCVEKSEASDYSKISVLAVDSDSDALTACNLIITFLEKQQRSLHLVAFLISAYTFNVKKLRAQQHPNILLLGILFDLHRTHNPSQSFAIYASFPNVFADQPRSK